MSNISNFSKQLGYLAKIEILKGSFNENQEEEQGKIDPYVKVIVQGQKFQTKVAQDQGRIPQWNQEFLLHLDQKNNQDLTAEVWDKNVGTYAPEFIGLGKINIEQYIEEGPKEVQLPIERKGIKQGFISFKIDYRKSKQLNEQRSLTQPRLEDAKQDNNNTSSLSNLQHHNSSVIKGSEFFLTNQQLRNESKMKNIKLLNTLDARANETLKKLAPSQRLVKRLDSSLSPDKSTTSVFISSQKMYDPHRVSVGRKNNEDSSNFKDVDDYFTHMETNTELNLKAKHEVDYIMKQTYLSVVKKIHQQKIPISETAVEFEDQMDVQENEYEHIRSLEKQILKHDIDDYERLRKQLAVQVVDLEQESNSLRPEQTSERARIDALKKELTQRMLYIEDRIQVLRRTLIVDNNYHHFSSNPNLHTSQLELSVISMQKSILQQWEHDPEREKKRKAFVDKLMKQWHNLNSKRQQKIKEVEQQIESEENKIKQLEEEQKKEQNEKRKADIVKRLEQLNQKQKERLNHLATQNQKLEELKKQETLAKKYAEKDASYLEDLLQKRNQKLKEIKNHYKPINLEEINEHDQKFLNKQIEQSEKREQKKEQRAVEWSNFKVQFVGEKYKQIQEESRQPKNLSEEKLKRAQQKIEEHKKIQEEIKKNHFPKIDDRKKAQMTELMKALSHQTDFKQYNGLSQKVKAKRRFEGISKKRLELLEEEKKKQLAQLKISETLPSPPSPRTVGILYLKDDARFNKKTKLRSQSPYEDVKKAQSANDEKLPQIQSDSSMVKRIDYLKEIREKKILKNRDLMHDWQRYAEKHKNREGDDQNEEKLMLEAKRIERVCTLKIFQAAKRHEQLLKARNVSDNKLIQDEEVVDELLVNSIKAKLLVLDRDADIEIKKHSSLGNKKTSDKKADKQKPSSFIDHQKETSDKSDYGDEDFNS